MQVVIRNVVSFIDTAVERARLLSLQADVIAAVTVEAMKGTVRGFDPRVHKARPHTGQGAVARHLRSLLSSKLHPSQISGLRLTIR